ncbi:MAG: YceI family protein [Rickettsiales bacterium]
MLPMLPIKKTCLLTCMSALAFTTAAFTTPALAADKYEFDKSHTRILFYINHLGFSDMVGEFTDYDGYFTFDESKPEESSVNVSINPLSVRTSSAELDKKLQNSDFFNSEKFPKITFTSDKIEITGKNTGKVHGKVTMLGVSKPVTLDVTFNKAATNSYSGKYIAGFSASSKLKRSDFKMNSYLPAIGDEVRVEIQTEGIKTDK